MKNRLTNSISGQWRMKQNPTKAIEEHYDQQRKSWDLESRKSWSRYYLEVDF